MRVNAALEVPSKDDNIRQSQMSFRAIIVLVVALLSCPQARAKNITERDRNHWAFQPIKRIQPPVLQGHKDPIQHPIDCFIIARLETNGLALSVPATKEQLIRRVTFGLIG